MKKINIPLLILLLLLGVSGQAFADMSTPTQSFSWSTGGVHDFTFTPFDKSLGTLTGVTVTLTGDIQTSLRVENTNSVAVSNATIQVYSPLTVSIGTSASPAVLVLKPSVTQSVSLGASDGSFDFSGNSGHSYSLLVGPSITENYTLSSAQLSSFLSAGDILKVTNGNFSFTSSVSGLAVPPNTIFANSTVGVSYNYTAVPVPGAIWLLGSGLLGLLGLRRKAILPSLLLVLFLGVSGQAWATTISQTQSNTFITDTSNLSSSWNWTPTFAPFSVAGTLNSVKVELFGSMTMDVLPGNFGPETLTPTWTFFQPITTLYSVSGPTLFSSTPLFVSTSLFSETATLASYEFQTFLGVSTPIAGQSLFTGLDMAAYASGFTLNIFALDPTGSTDDESFFTFGTWNKIVDVVNAKVTYDYTPAPVPEPSTVWLLGSGAVCLIGAVGLRRKVTKSES